MSTNVPSRVCSDANLVVRFLAQPQFVGANRLWSDWIRHETKVLAPDMFRFEVTNALHRMAMARDITDAEASSALDTVWTLPIEYSTAIGIHRRALALSRELNLPAAYDAHYLALAEFEGVEFFTSDRRLYNAARHRFEWIRLVE